jgi:hypothetical protein
VYGREMVAVPAAGIRRFLMQSPYHVLSRHVLAHMLGPSPKCGWAESRDRDIGPGFLPLAFCLRDVE